MESNRKKTFLAEIPWADKKGTHDKLILLILNRLTFHFHVLVKHLCFTCLLLIVSLPSLNFIALHDNAGNSQMELKGAVINICLCLLLYGCKPAKKKHRFQDISVWERWNQGNNRSCEYDQYWINMESGSICPQSNQTPFTLWMWRVF